MQVWFSLASEAPTAGVRVERAPLQLILLPREFHHVPKVDHARVYSSVRVGVFRGEVRAGVVHRNNRCAEWGVTSWRAPRRMEPRARVVPPAVPACALGAAAKRPGDVSVRAEARRLIAARARAWELDS